MRYRLLLIASLVALGGGCAKRTDPWTEKAQAKQAAALAEAETRLDGCLGGDVGQCAAYCEHRPFDHFDLERDRKLRHDAVCKRACDAGQQRSCVFLGEFLGMKDKSAARTLFTAACDAKVPLGCARLVQWFADARTPAALGNAFDLACNSNDPECWKLLQQFPDTAPAALIDAKLSKGCEGGDSVTCFMQAMNGLAKDGDVAKALALARNGVAHTSPAYDHWANHRLIECLEGKSFGWADPEKPEATGAELSPARRQESCLHVESVASTNFPHLRTYRLGLGRIAAIPWTMNPGAGAVNLSVLPRGKGWYCCALFPPYGYEGSKEPFCERTQAACSARLASFTNTAGYQVSGPKLAEQQTGYCFVGGTKRYRCFTDEQLCAARAKQEYAGTCLRWGNDEDGATAEATPP